MNVSQPLTLDLSLPMNEKVTQIAFHLYRNESLYPEQKNHPKHLEWKVNNSFITLQEFREIDPKRYEAFKEHRYRQMSSSEARFSRILDTFEDMESQKGILNFIKMIFFANCILAPYTIYHIIFHRS